jgi:hypothetical protein
MIHFLLPVVTIILVIAKLTGPLASWSWWLVFSPVIAQVVIFVVLVLAFIAVALKK